MDAFYDRRVTSPEPQKIYFVLTAEKWKKRYYNHKKSFSHKRYSHEMTLSSYVWYLKESLDTASNLQMVSSEVYFVFVGKIGYYYLFKRARTFK